MQLKAVLFDLDDTLYTSWEACDQAAYAAVDAYAERELHIPQFQQIFHRARGAVMRALNGAGSSHDRTIMAQRALEEVGANPFYHAEAMAEAYWTAVLETMRPWPETQGLLADLQQAGIKVVICTNMTAQVQLRKVRKLGLAESIDYLVSSEEAGADKPAPQIFRLGLEKAGVLREEAVFVGDSYTHDVVGAQDIGMDAIWLNWTRKPAPMYKTCVEVHSMAEVAKELRKRMEALE